jgi:alkanesulfonate monooxygenase SsuD/methylene tetrahydromethanopterin reductase-like flavin-dependent oxidoreductase (luciferase family)
MGDRLAAIARSAEEAGFAGVSFMDHLVQIPQVGRPWENIPEIFIAMSHVAAHSSRLEVGPLVLNMTLRNPAVVAKAVATLDVLSAGRAFCGVGAGWNESEEVGYGFPRRTTSERMEMLEEGVQVMRSMWAPGPSSFSGSTIVLDGAVAYPRPVRGHVPIVVGGGGERRTLRIAAEHADAINVLGGPEVIARKRAVLAEHCLDVGRDPSEIATTVLDVALVGENRGHVADLVDRYRGRAGAQAYVRRVNAGTVADQVERYAALGEIGTDRVFVALVDLDGPGPVERFGGVIAALDAAVG